MAKSVGNAPALFDEGLTALRSGNLAAALAAFDQVVRLAPRVAAGHHMRGIVLQNLGRLVEADEAISRAIGCDSREPDFFANRALVRSGLRQFARALADGEAALALEPDHHGGLTNLALAQIALARHADAEATLRRLVDKHPRFAQGYGNLGIALAGLGRHAEARVAFEAGLALAPENLEMLRGLGDALGKSGETRAAPAAHRRAIALQPGHVPTWSSYLFQLNYADDIAPAEKAAAARQFGQLLEGSVRPLPATPVSRTDRPLRIGFVSGDLRSHSVSLFLLGVLPALRKLGDELVAFSTSPHADETTDMLRPCFAGWHDISATGDTEAARLVRGDGIDVLVDLSGHSAGQRLGLFALRPSPLAVSWLGYSATTGLRRIDYVIADARVLPPELEPLFTERPLRLPDSFLCFSPHVFEPAHYDTDGPVTFGSFNAAQKLSDATVSAWSRLLVRVPGSRLLLKDRIMADEVARHAIEGRFAAHGIGPERLTLMARTPSREEHFALYGRLTMALDPFPYAGTTTTMEALIAGVPVLTLDAGGFVTRVGASILNTAGLNDWIARDVDDYVERGARLVAEATQPGFRQRLRAWVLASPLCDADRFARNWHAAIHKAWAAAAEQ